MLCLGRFEARDRRLRSSDAFGDLSLGQAGLGASPQYTLTTNLTLTVQASNLTNALYKQYMQQGIGLMERGAFYTGRRYSIRLGYSF